MGYPGFEVEGDQKILKGLYYRVNEMSTFVHVRYTVGQSNVHMDQKKENQNDFIDHGS